MKKSLFALCSTALVAILATSCGIKPEATVDGTVTGIADGTMVYLHDYAGTKLDSVAVAGGTFRFDIPKAYPDVAFLLIEGAGRPHNFFVEPGAITATVDATATPPAVLFAGTPTNDGKKLVDDKNADTYEQYRAVTGKLSNSTEGTPEYDALLAECYRLEGQSEQNIKDAVMAAPNTVLAAFFVYNSAYSYKTPEMVDSVLTITADAPANAFTDRLREIREALARTAVGQPAPDFTQNQPDGTPFSLSSLKGKLVLIDFWASWCGPCRAENPNVVKLYDAYKDKGFEILGVSLDEDRAAWLKAIEDDGLVWKQVSDLKGWQNAVATQYGVKSIPHTVLVSPDGAIVANDLRGAELEAKVAEVLGEAAASATN